MLIYKICDAALWRQAEREGVFRGAAIDLADGYIHFSTAAQVAEIIEAKAIAAFSLSGATAMRIARERPDVPILGLTPSLETARRLALVWGVHALTSEVTHTMTETVAQAAELARHSGFAKRRDEIVVIAGVPFGRSGGTNSLRVAQVT